MTRFVAEADCNFREEQRPNYLYKGSNASIQGRNGFFDLVKIRITGSGNFLAIDGIGQRGHAINGGFIVRDLKIMDRLAAKWLHSRGLIDKAVIFDLVKEA